jgi:LacI family transcriptional regulator
MKADRLETMRERGISVTLLDREIKGRKQCSVSVDDVHGGQIAIEYLTGLGHKHVAWVCGPESIPQVADRGAGVAKAGKVANIKIETVRVSLMNAVKGKKRQEKF